MQGKYLRISFECDHPSKSHQTAKSDYKIGRVNTSLLIPGGGSMHVYTWLSLHLKETIIWVNNLILLSTLADFSRLKKQIEKLVKLLLWQMLDSPWEKYLKPTESLLKGRISTGDLLTSLDQHLLMANFFFQIHKTSNLNKEVNCTKLSPKNKDSMFRPTVGTILCAVTLIYQARYIRPTTVEKIYDTLGKGS